MSAHAINGLTLLGAFSGDAAAEASMTRPPEDGDHYYNTTTKISRSYDGTVWANVIATPVNDDKNLTAAVTTGDGDNALGVATLTKTPGGDSFIAVLVNGVLAQLALTSGTKATSECYFSGDGGTTARNVEDIVATDTLHWNGSVAGFELAVTDVIDLIYSAVI